VNGKWRSKARKRFVVQVFLLLLMLIIEIRERAPLGVRDIAEENEIRVICD
jgi:hypothetical protein